VAAAAAAAVDEEEEEQQSLVIPRRRRGAGRSRRGVGLADRAEEKLRKLMDQLSSAKLLLSAPRVTDTVWTG